MADKTMPNADPAQAAQDAAVAAAQQQAAHQAAQQLLSDAKIAHVKRRIERSRKSRADSLSGGSTKRMRRLVRSGSTGLKQ